MRRKSLPLIPCWAGCAQQPPRWQEKRLIRLTDAPGHDMVASRCVTCHSLDYVTMNAPVLDRTGWEKTIRKMVDRFGAPISDEEVRQILDYLASNY